MQFCSYNTQVIEQKTASEKVRNLEHISDKNPTILKHRVPINRPPRPRPKGPEQE